MVIWLGRVRIYGVELREWIWRGRRKGWARSIRRGRGCWLLREAGAEDEGTVVVEEGVVFSEGLVGVRLHR